MRQAFILGSVCRVALGFGNLFDGLRNAAGQSTRRLSDGCKYDVA